MVPTTNDDSPLFFRPASHWCAARSPWLSCSSSATALLRPRRTSAWKSSLKRALPCASHTERIVWPAPASGRRSSHASTRLNMASLVARVGSATKQPPAPERAASTSAAASAASVLPSPIGASITSSPGPDSDWASWTALACTGRQASSPNPKRAASSDPAGPDTAAARHGAGSASADQAASSRAAVRSSAVS
jgi:hypothetical protein